MDWFIKSIASMLLMTPFIIIANAFGRIGIKPEAMVFYWLFASTFGVGFWIFYSGNGKDLMPSNPLLFLLVIGIICGGLSNRLLINAVVECFNPGLPIAIVGINSLIIFLVTPFLAIVIPKYFQHVEFNGISFLGIIFTVVGIALISINK